MAWSGMLVPSGSRPSWPSAPALVTVRLVVQAPESSASGTRAVAFWNVLNRVCDAMSWSPCIPATGAQPVDRLLPGGSPTHT